MILSRETLHVYESYLKYLLRNYEDLQSKGKKTIHAKSRMMSKMTCLKGGSLNMFKNWLYENGMAVKDDECSSKWTAVYVFDLEAVKSYFERHPSKLNGQSVEPDSVRGTLQPNLVE
jgi:hypothetical protein